MDREFFEQLRILALDDEPLMRDLIRAILKGLGIRDVVTVDGAEAAFIELRKGRRFDLVTCDYSMKPISGTEFATALRRDKTHPARKIPIIMLTASTESGVVAEAMRAGVDDYVTKPISAASLGARISGIINRPRQFIDTMNYTGPDRRRNAADKNYTGPRRRKTDTRQSKRDDALPELGVED